MKRGIDFLPKGQPNRIYVHGAITDVHMHPRLFDARFPDAPAIPNGKAGMSLYSQNALKNGFYMGLAMGNESVRLYTPDNPDQTQTVPYPISNLDRLLAAAAVVTEQSRMMAGINMVADREILGIGDDMDMSGFTTEKVNAIYSSRYVREYTAALKIYGDETTGGFNIPLEAILPVARVWHEHDPSKPIILHLENEAVRQVLEGWPADIPVHIAHVSSRLELEPIIEAKQAGKNVTCEATPHHLFLTEATSETIGAYGCMKPSLKTPEDVKFLWDNIEYIDIFASDCAPHRHIDKVGPDGKDLDRPAFGVTNHDEFLPLFFQAIVEGRLNEQQLYERIVKNPIERFNLPDPDVSACFSLEAVTARQVTRSAEFGCDPFVLSPETPPMLGRLAMLDDGGGRVVINDSYPIFLKGPSYKKLVRF